MSLQQLQTCVEKVEHLLNKFEIARDSDDVLYSAYLSHHLHHDPRYDLDTMSAKDMLIMMSDGQLPKMDTITRVSRKLQKSYPHLRGEKYIQKYGLV